MIRTGTRARKSSAGLDLTALMIGAEGTLGIITELTLKLNGIPEATSAASCAFDSIEGAVATVVDTIQMGLPVARMELVDPGYIAAINARHDLGLPDRPHLFLEFNGSEAGVREQAEMVAALAVEHGGAAFSWTTRVEDRNQLWIARHNAYASLNAMYPGRRALVTDMCVPISHLADMVQTARADIAQTDLPAGIIGHVGDGNFHAQLMLREGNAQDLATAKELARAMARRALAVDGTITGEHGIGMGKTDLMAEEHGPAWAVMGEIKRALDPKGILNPGKMYSQE